MLKSFQTSANREIEMKTDTSTIKPKVVSESRRIRKPLMEKKRRARINDSLETLKQILLDSKTTLKSSSRGGQRTAKLEKADILEMTVHYLQQLHGRFRENCSSTMDSDKLAIKKNNDVTKQNEIRIEKYRKSVITARRSEIAIRQADSSCDSFKTHVTLLPTKLMTGEIVYFLPSNVPIVQENDEYSDKCDETSSGPLWRPW